MNKQAIEFLPFSDGTKKDTYSIQDRGDEFDP